MDGSEKTEMKCAKCKNPKTDSALHLYSGDPLDPIHNYLLMWLCPKCRREAHQLLKKFIGDNKRTGVNNRLRKLFGMKIE
jgi:hypothetical protein